MGPLPTGGSPRERLEARLPRVPTSSCAPEWMFTACDPEEYATEQELQSRPDVGS